MTGPKLPPAWKKNGRDGSYFRMIFTASEQMPARLFWNAGR